MPKDHDHITYAFEKSVIQMQNDLKYLVDKAEVSERFISKQNAILKNIINYQQSTDDYIKRLEKENTNIYLEYRNQIKNLENRIISFEAICIIHGIMDFPVWLYMGKDSLEHRATLLGKNKKMQLSTLFDEKLAKLPKQDRKTIETILFREQKNKISVLIGKLKNFLQKDTEPRLSIKHKLKIWL